MSVTKQQRAFYQTFSQHGSGNAMVEIGAKDVILLTHIAYRDLFGRSPDWFIPAFEQLALTRFYEITQSMVEELPAQSEADAIDCLRLCGASNTENIIFLYLKNLAELYRRRFKFYHILKTQPFPTVEQIGPRCLLEYGNCDDTLLFSWMKWRKLIYDVDNRSAQETGYLFEPLLASCLGGKPVSHSRSPIRRRDEHGRPTDEGRQIDCYVEETKEAYELKLRVSIAASGQGRFSEELRFPREAKMAGLTPILIVFDPTPSPRLKALTEQYEAVGGWCAVGDDAWDVLIRRAGAEMGKFIEKYIKPPITKMETLDHALPSGVNLRVNCETISVSDALGNEYRIPRSVPMNPSDPV